MNSKKESPKNKGHFNKNLAGVNEVAERAALHVEINLHKVRKVDFSKNEKEKVEAHNAKLEWKRHMRRLNPSFKSKQHKYFLAATING